VAKPNFRQKKRQKEQARKERQSERLTRRGERPVEADAVALSGPDPKPPGGAI
jgi:hypothetical protein